MSLFGRIKLFLAMGVVVILGLGSALPALASADTAKQTVCQTLGAGADCTQNTQGSVSLNSIIKTVINIFSFVIGVVAVIMIMISGYRFVTSGGDSSKVSSARSTITYALVGIVVAALAQGIVRFVLKSI